MQQPFPPLLRCTLVPLRNGYLAPQLLPCHCSSKNKHLSLMGIQNQPLFGLNSSWAFNSSSLVALCSRLSHHIRSNELHENTYKLLPLLSHLPSSSRPLHVSSHWASPFTTVNSKSLKYQILSSKNNQMLNGTLFGNWQNTCNLLDHNVQWQGEKFTLRKQKLEMLASITSSGEKTVK